MSEQKQDTETTIRPRDLIVSAIEDLGKIRVPIEDDETVRLPIVRARAKLIAFANWLDDLEAKQKGMEEPKIEVCPCCGPETEGCGDVQT